MRKVLTIGGGTGNFVVLRGLKHFDLDLSAVVSMTDNGGSTGILRDELGVLPPGDVRQCLVALSSSSKLMRDLMNYRFEVGGLQGHNFGNLLLSSLEKITGSFEKAIEEVGKILNINGKVIPVTTNKTHLKMLLKDGELLNGEREISISKNIWNGFTSLYLDPTPKANPQVIKEIIISDMIVFSPGGLYTSLIPNLLVTGVTEALKKTKAKKVFVANLVNKNTQTPGFKVGDYLKEIENYIGEDIWDYVIVNRGKPSEKLVKTYAEEASLVENDLDEERVLQEDIINKELKKVQKGDLLNRNLIRHDSDKLAKVLMRILDNFYKQK